MSGITLPIYQGALTDGSPDKIQLGSGNSISTGVESILEYDSKYFNVRNWVDTVVVTEIDGMADADVRDTREVNPSAHGETPYNSFYGGRTITLTGYIRTFNLSKLRDMQYGLRQMFVDVNVEKPLIFHGLNSAQDCMIYCKKNQPIAMKEAQTNFQYNREFLITLRASNPRILSLYTKFVQWKNLAGTTSFSNYKIFDVYNEGNFNAEPQIQLTGPITNPRIKFYDKVQKKYVYDLYFNSDYAISSGQTVYIDVAKRSIVNQVGESLYRYVNVDASMPEYIPGVHELHISGTGTNATTEVVTMWRNTWI